MSHTTDGGPAFPIPRNHDSGDAIFARGDGMTLRDWLAGQYIAGRAARRSIKDWDESADHAYLMADAMLRAREK